MFNSSANVYQSVSVLVDSRHRNNPDAYNITNFTYTLDREIGRVSRVYVESAQIPFTYYTTNSSNNQLDFGIGGVRYSAVVITGNYTSGTVLAAVKTALDGLAIPGAVWTVGFNQARLKVDIAAGLPNFEIFILPNSMWPSLGFNVDAGPAPMLASDGVLDLSGPRYLVIKSRTIGETRSYPIAVAAVYSAVVESAAIIHTIPVNTNPGGIILDLPSETRYNILGYKVAFQNNIDFRLEDDRGNLLDLNGNNWSVQFTFELR